MTVGMMVKAIAQKFTVPKPTADMMLNLTDKIFEQAFAQLLA